jgi:hypothetical protein
MAWTQSGGGQYLHKFGPARERGESHCTHKLCITATDEAALADLLNDLVSRDDCYFVKRSCIPRDGMFLGRCFLTDEAEVGRLWQHLKAHPKFYCSVQDDDWSVGFREE